jgi:hypothetical protein
MPVSQASVAEMLQKLSGQAGRMENLARPDLVNTGI